MKLIIDSGTTKTHWVLLDGKKLIEDFKTTGFNPYYTPVEEIKRSISAELPGTMKNREVDNIYFYGTGCSTAANCTKVKDILQDFFKNALVETHHDLYAAAVALQKNRRGIAAILGTGSNSCLWNGENIVENVPSVGWILGDEGSATYLGKLLLKAFLSGEMDKDITRTFYDTIHLDFEGALHKIYGEPNPNRWISGLSPFASSHMQHPQVRELIKKNFRDFLSAQVKKYTGYRKEEISFTGSVAWHFREILHEVLQEEGLHLGIILQEPMDGLIEYHAQETD